MNYRNRKEILVAEEKLKNADDKERQGLKKKIETLKKEEKEIMNKVAEISKKERVRRYGTKAINEVDVIC